MELKSIGIQKLFGLFDYNIELNNAENLTILTGPLFGIASRYVESKSKASPCRIFKAGVLRLTRRSLETSPNRRAKITCSTEDKRAKKYFSFKKKLYLYENF
ncbi:MAG: hypothetical protein LBT50_06575 [Prevotellaceae bacterium]|jgi:hypothetical protein|nr:hypothetical protein [Prevotellaceae bacterium]